MFGTVTSAELKTRTLTSLPDGCAACTAAMEIQDNKIRRRLICVFIKFPPYPNPKLSIRIEARVEGRVSKRGSRAGCRGEIARPATLDPHHSTLVTRFRSPAAAEILIHHLLLLLPSLFFLFFNPYP